MRLSELVLLTVVAGLACATKDPVAPARADVSVTLALSDTVIEVGQTTEAVAIVRDANGSPIGDAVVTYVSDGSESVLVNPTSGSIRGIAPGIAAIVVSIDGVSDRQSLRVFETPVRINEIYPNGERPGGWVELYNPTFVAIDMAGWTISGGDSTRRFTIPSGAIIPADGYLAVNEVTLPVSSARPTRSTCSAAGASRWRATPGRKIPPRHSPGAPTGSVPSRLRSC